MNEQRGATSLLVLVMTILFVVIMIAGVGLIARQGE